MRKWINLLEAAGQNTQNGFWITHAGEFLYNDWENEIHHMTVAANHFHSDGSVDFDIDDLEAAFDHAMELGWIRVIVIPGMELNAQWGRKPDRKALRVLRSFVMQSGTEFPNYYIEGMEGSDDPEVGIDKRTFLAILEKHIGSQTIQESTEPLLDDAAWILPDGTVLPVLFMGHSDEYLEWLRENDPEELENLKHTINIKKETPVANTAREKGWIRYLSGSNYGSANKSYIATFHYSKISAATAKTCLDLLHKVRKYKPMLVELSVPYRIVPFSEAIIYFKSIAKTGTIVT